MDGQVTLTLIAAFVVGTLAVARATRLWVDDDWPPVMAIRNWYLSKVSMEWMDLATCPFCAAPWFALADLGLGWLSYNEDGKLDWWWWLPNIWFAVAYLAAMVTTRDLPPEQRE